MRYPNYRLCIDGIGSAPEGFEHVGDCSQIVCFVRRDLIEENAPISFDGRNDDDSYHLIEKFKYESVCCHDYPVFEELRTREEIIHDEAKSFFNRYIYLYDEEFYYNYDRDLYEFPLAAVHGSMNTDHSLEELRDVLKQHYTVSDADVIELPGPNEDDRSSSEAEEPVLSDQDAEMQNAKSEEEW